MRSEEEILREAGEVGMELASLKNRATLLEVRRRELDREYAKLRWGVEPGVIVKTASRGRLLTGGKVYDTEVRVISVDRFPGTPARRPWVTGTVRTKLGDWGVKSRKLYDYWRLPSELEEEEGR
jgi:hypothetical protein